MKEEKEFVRYSKNINFDFQHSSEPSSHFAPKGDSGGALVNEHKVQIGIVSWGYSCAAQGMNELN